jgi:Kef-type K+ transport system membrane component KefB
VTFLAGTGAIVLTFLAGAELDPRVLRMKWKEAAATGLVSFAARFLGCTAIACGFAAVVLPWLTPRYFRRFGGRPSELEAKYLMLMLFGLGALATWADSDAVLPRN